MSAGRLKVFDSCGAWFEEFRLYRRDEKGRIVKQHDHLMDCTRYLVRARHERMKTKRPEKSAEDYEDRLRRKMDGRSSSQDWMAW